MTIIRVIKAAQRLGFTLDEVAELLDLGGHRHGKPRLQARASAKLAEVEAKIADLEIIRGTLRAAVAAGCDDLIACPHVPSCPLPFADLAERKVSDGGTCC